MWLKKIIIKNLFCLKCYIQGLIFCNLLAKTKELLLDQIQMLKLFKILIPFIWGFMFTTDCYQSVRIVNFRVAEVIKKTPRILQIITVEQWGLGSLTIAFTGEFVYIWLTISSCYGSIPLTLVLLGRDGGFSTLCHDYRFACQQGLLKTFPGSDYLRSEDGVVWLWYLPVNLCLYGSPFHLVSAQSFWP